VLRRQKPGTVFRQKWRHQRHCRHLNLNLKLTFFIITSQHVISPNFPILLYSDCNAFAYVHLNFWWWWWWWWWWWCNSWKQFFKHWHLTQTQYYYYYIIIIISLFFIIIAPSWPSNSPYVYPVYYKIWSVIQSRVHGVDQLKQCLMDVWHGMEQSVIDIAIIDEWRIRIRANEDTVSINCDTFNNLLKLQ